MKKLKFLLIPLFSLLFIINVKANTNYEYYFEFKYGEVLNLKQTYSNEISVVDEYLNNIYSTGTAIPYQVGWNTRYIYLNTGNFVAVYDLSSFENEVKTLYLFDVVTYPITMRIPEGTNPFSIGFITGLYYKIQFKIQNNTFVPYGTNGYQSIMPIYESTTSLNDNLIFLEDKYLFNTTWLTSENGLNSDLNLNNLSSTYNFPLMVNGTLYYPTTTVKLIDYLNNYEPNESTCLEVPFQIGSASQVQQFVFNIHGVSSKNNKIKGYLELRSKDFEGIGINADALTDITYESGSDNQSEYTFNYSVEWVNESSSNPIYKINYELYSNGSGGFDSYNQVLLNVSLKQTNVTLYFRENVDIFAYTNCRPDTISYGYINYTDNSTITSDPYLQNYFNNLSLPNLKWFNNLNTLLPIGPVDSILTIPLQMLNSINDSLGGNCQSINVTLPYVNRNVELKCINSFYENIGAGNFVSWVGTVASVLILINYFVFLYNWLESVLALSQQNLEVWGSASLIDPNWESRR